MAAVEQVTTKATTTTTTIIYQTVKQLEYMLKDLGSIPGTDKKVVSFPTLPALFWSPPKFLVNGYRPLCFR
jgi:hypothetical protein